jgi:molybdopterin molybdotransferase
MIPVPEAIDRLLAAVTPLPPIEIPCERALGRTIAEDVRADRDAPAADRSAMDGFALRSEDLTSPGAVLRITGEVRAGASPAGIRVSPGSCVRIYTGAVVPEGADAVEMVERTVEDAGSVRFQAVAEHGQNIRRRGEDRKRGDLVVAAGALLRPAELASLAAVGKVTVSVVRPPRVAVMSTGDELVSIDRTPAPHQVRNSNAPMLAALVAEQGFAAVDLGVAPDDLAGLDGLLERGLAHDALLVSGGVSVGAYDLVGEALALRGASVLFHQVAMRPGKPILAARCGTCLVLGLPGNPVSAFTAYHVFAAAALRKLAGHPQPVRPLLHAALDARLARRPGRRVYALGRLDRSAGRVSPVASASSGDLFALAGADAFIVVEPGDRPLEAGATVEVLAWA